jgi:8-oxo-dGTP pyrophosphatase MutT (NUDIX family)
VSEAPALRSTVLELRPLIEANLAAFERRAVAAAAGVRRAAVAVTLLDRGDEPNFLVIKRVPRGRNAGQWALPGGRLDGAEDAVSAALRELAEETNLVAGPGDVVGLLDDFVTASGFVITPVVVVPPPGQRPRRSPDEVSSVHHVPVRRLLSPDVPRWRRQPDGSMLLQMPLRPYMVVHAPTGAIVWQFAEVALRGLPRRVSHLEQPAFTAV